MERLINGQTEKQFLEWLYTVIGDDEIDYMLSISDRIGELNAIEHIQIIQKVAKGCGVRNELLPECENVFFTCGDNRCYEKGDEPTLCMICKRKLNDLIKEHKERFNPSYEFIFEVDD